MNFFSFLGLGRRQVLSPLSRSPSQRIYVVDVTGLVENRSKNGNGHPSPRDHFLILRNLAQFAGRERIDLAAVFIGRPLREAGEGGQYKGVKAYYAENTEMQMTKLTRLVREYLRTRDVVLITGNSELERQAVALKAVSMRSSTLRKAMDERDDRGDRDNDRPFRSRRRSRPAEERRQVPERSERPPESERPAPKPSDASASTGRPEPGVLDLIDPV